MAAANQVSGGGLARRRWAGVWPTLAALLIVGVGAYVRFAIAVRHSDAPGIDENEVVEQAVAFMGPDLKHYFIEYGPLTMFVLSGIYRIAAWLDGQTNLEYASRVFFEGAEHYAIARVYTYSWLSVLALAAFIILRRQLARHLRCSPARCSRFRSSRSCSTEPGWLWRDLEVAHCFA